MFRRATAEDLPAIVTLLAADQLGATREDAHRFYANLGFEPSHVGYKLKLQKI